MASMSGHGSGTDFVYEHMRAAIVEGRYEPGQRLIEQRIAEELATSRTPVREAVRRLEVEGLVTTSPNRGAAVREISVSEIVDLYGLRARLESYAAELAATRMPPEEIVALGESVDRYSAACHLVGDRSDAEAVRHLNETNAQIHELIVIGARHQRLHAMLRRAVDIPLVFGAFRDFGPTERQRSDLFHRLILDAIAHGDGNRAGQLMIEHIAQGRDGVLRRLRTDERAIAAPRGRPSAETLSP